MIMKTCMKTCHEFDESVISGAFNALSARVGKKVTKEDCRRTEEQDIVTFWHESK